MRILSKKYEPGIILKQTFNTIMSNACTCAWYFHAAPRVCTLVLFIMPVLVSAGPTPLVSCRCPAGAAHWCHRAHVRVWALGSRRRGVITPYRARPSNDDCTIGPLPSATSTCISVDLAPGAGTCTVRPLRTRWLVFFVVAVLACDCEV